MNIMLTLLQFIALAVPAVAMMMQVALQFQDRYMDEENPAVGKEFQLMEASLLVLVLGGVLVAVPIGQSLSSGIAQLGIGLALLALLFLVLATGWALRRPRYPTDNYKSVEEAAIKTGKKVGLIVFTFLIGGIATISVGQLFRLTSVFLSFDSSSTESLTQSITTVVQILPTIMVAMVILETFAGIARLQN